jgi:hypothetical protein
MSADRDTYSDCSRDGSDQKLLKDVGYVLSFAPLTVEQEYKLNGYNLGDKPTGKGSLRPLDTSGHRGASDIG